MQEVGAGLMLFWHPGPEADITAPFDKETDVEVKNKSAAGATAECAVAAWLEGGMQLNPQSRKTRNKTEQQQKKWTSLSIESHIKKKKSTRNCKVFDKTTLEPSSKIWQKT